MTRDKLAEAERRPESGCDAAPETVAMIRLAARLAGRRLEPEAIRDRLASVPVSPTLSDVSRTLDALGVPTRQLRRYRDLVRADNAPAVVQWRQGGFGIVLAADRTGSMVQTTAGAAAQRLSRAEFLARWNSEAIAVCPDHDNQSDVTSITRWLLGALAQHRALLFDVLAASAFVQVFALVTPLIFMVVIDKVLSHRSLTSLDVLVMALALVTVFEVLLSALRAHVLSRTTARMDLELSGRLFRHVVSLPVSYFVSRRSGDTVARMRELESVRQFITGTGATAVLDVMFLFLFLAVMALFSITLTAVVVGMLCVVMVLSVLVTPLLRSRLETRLSRGADSQSFLVETVAGIETIKSFAAENVYQRQWEDRAVGQAQASIRSNGLSSMASQLTTLLSKATIVLLLWLGARMVMEGSLTVGQLIAFNMLATRVNAPVLRIAQLWQELQQARVSFRRIAELMRCSPEPVHDSARTALPAIRGEIAFQGVCFRYRPDRPEVLHDVSFRIGAGEKVAVVGPFGSGKSTVARLVQRLYIAQQGRVLVDGIDVSAVDGAWLRSQIGIVSQDVRLMDCSIRDNIALGRPDAEVRAVTAAADLAGAHDFIVKLPEGYDTLAGEQGAQLSTGQRQCLAIARALLVDPPVLILDEATSSLDHEAERVLCGNIGKIAAGRTLIIITHRPSLLAHVERVLVLREGRLERDGSPQDVTDHAGFAESDQPKVLATAGHSA